MKGNVVTAAKLLCVAMILSALILVFGVTLAVALNRAQPAQPATASAQIPKIDLSAFFKPNQYSSDPNERMRELLLESENGGQIDNEKRRFWLLNTPSTLTYERVSGAMEP